jgi:Uma2 family endonuclease
VSSVSSLEPLAAADEPVCDWLPAMDSIYRLSIEQYEAMVASGVFKKRDRLQLINGFLVSKMTEHPLQAVASTMLWEASLPLVAPGWHLRLDKPLRIPNSSSVPEPELVMVRGSAQDFLEAHPGPADVGLVVEVADSSLRLDQAMATVYGRAGIPIYWIVNLVDRQLEVYSGPCASGYGSREILKPDDVVSLIIEGALRGKIRVDDLLPRRRN